MKLHAVEIAPSDKVANRRARIDSLSVDRSKLREMSGYFSNQPLCPEAEECEERLRHIRLYLTESEKIAAWRGLGLNVK